MEPGKKVAIVTGANSGVGYEVTRGLLQEGFHVVMACRSLDKAIKAKDQLLAEQPSSQLDVLALDLSDLDSVRSFAKELKSKYGYLNLLVNNAGILLKQAEVNSSGIEKQFATNHLGHFLLTSLLIEMMPDSPESRVVSLSSLAHKKGEIFFNDLSCKKQKKWDAAYSQSKLACLMFGDELHRRLEAAGKKILSVSAHPGGTDSGLFDSMPKAFMLLLRLTFVPLFLHSTESAARPVLKAALESGVKGMDYFGPTGLMEMKGAPGVATRTEYSQREDVAAKLWSLSEELTNSSFKIQSTNSSPEQQL